MTDNKSHSLELISNSSHSDATPVKTSQSSAEKRKKPRINLTSEQFRIHQNGKVFSVLDLSTDGMAFRIIDQEDLIMMPVATRIEGTLNLHGTKHVVQAKVRHLGLHMVGCQFVDLGEEVRKALHQFLDPAELGRELRPIPSSDSGVLWYHGPGGTDLLLSRRVDGQYHRLTLFVLGSFIQWDETQGLTTGRAAPSQERSDQRMEEWGVVQFETMLMDADSAADHDKLTIAKALILSLNLPQDLKKWCLRQILPQ